MKVSVDNQLCQGHGLCVSEAPTVYLMDERQHCTIPIAIVPVEFEAAARRGAIRCPEEAISILEDD